MRQLAWFILFLTVFFLQLPGLDFFAQAGATEPAQPLHLPSSGGPSASTPSATASCKTQDGKILLDFEGLGNRASVGEAYLSCGALFSNEALSLIDEDSGGTGNFANEPSPNTVLFFLDGDSTTLNFTSGIVGGFSFYYSSIDYSGWIKVYSGLDCTGDLLATLNLPGLTRSGQGDPNGYYDVWAKIGVEFGGVARSIDFGGTADYIAFDNITLNSADVAGTEVVNFEFALIDDQVAGQYFDIRILAVDQYGSRILNFDDRVQLTTSAGPLVVPESESGFVFQQGEFSGRIQVRQAVENCTLVAQHGDIVSSSNFFNVASPADAVARLLGEVKNIFGLDEAGATVKLFKASDTENVFKQTTSNSYGEYAFIDLPYGSYKIQAFNGNGTICSNVLDVSLVCQASTLNLYLVSTGKKALIILPGIMGSTVTTASGYILHPELTESRLPNRSLLKPFNPLNVLGIEDFGGMMRDYGDYDIYYCPYDWRASLYATWHKYLMDIIDEALEHSSYPKVDIVAHSMGGLVARAYIQSDEFKQRQDVDKIVMLGTPNGGSCNVYWSYEGGDPKRCDDLTSVFNTQYKTLKANYEIMNPGQLFKDLSKRERMEFIQADVPSTRQLAPVYDFLNVEGEAQPGPAPFSINYWLKDLNDLSTSPGLQRLVYSNDAAYCADNPCVETRLFISDEEKTIRFIYVRGDAKSDGTYLSGAPYDPDPVGDVTDSYREDEAEFINGGDGTVPSDPACAPLAQNDGRICTTGDFGTHISYFKSDDIKRDVFKFLTGNTLPDAALAVPEAQAAEVDHTVNLTIRGSVRPLLTDPDGSKIGLDPASSTVVDEIEDAELAMLEGTSSVEYIDGPSGMYSVTLTGDLAEMVTITLQFVQGDTIVEVTKHVFFLGQPLTFQFRVDSGGGTKIVLINPVDPPIEVEASDDSGNTFLTWQASTDTELAGYRVYARTEGQPLFSVLATLTKETTQYQTGQAWNADGSAMVRYYVVTAFRADGSESLFDQIIENRYRLAADFSAEQMNGSPPYMVKFTDKSSGSVSARNWDFNGDGVSDSTAASSQYSYPAEGTYTVTLKVEGEAGADYQTKTVSVAEIVTAAPIVSPAVRLLTEADPNADSDGDGITDAIENQGCTSATNADSDADRISDGVEDLNRNGQVDSGESNPCKADSDDDGLDDAEEDANRNGLTDAGETCAYNPDTDGDGMNDGDEVSQGFDPLDPASCPQPPIGAISLLLKDGEYTPPPQPTWGPDLASSGIASSNVEAATGHEPGLAIDDSTATLWGAADNLKNLNWSFRVDLSQPASPSRLGLNVGGSGWYGITSFTLQGWDADTGSWVTLTRGEHSLGMGNWQYFTFTPHECIYYRILVGDTYHPTTNTLPSINELTLQERR